MQFSGPRCVFFHVPQYFRSARRTPRRRPKMGSFYTNITVRHADVDAVVAALEGRGRTALVSPPANGCVVVFDEATEEQDTAELERVAKPLSKRLACAALAV